MTDRDPAVKRNLLDLIKAVVSFFKHGLGDTSKQRADSAGPTLEDSGKESDSQQLVASPNIDELYRVQECSGGVLSSTFKGPDSLNTPLESLDGPTLETTQPLQEGMVGLLPIECQLQASLPPPPPPNPLSSWNLGLPIPGLVDPEIY
ncbi:hypothetical protein L208DRAFT_1374152 [Tricholoma matsutake]|nr:hypothetical protein L208DRAFT_1374152 [Tricholoma matsutake 945]